MKLKRTSAPEIQTPSNSNYEVLHFPSNHKAPKNAFKQKLKEYDLTTHWEHFYSKFVSEKLIPIRIYYLTKRKRLNI